MDAQQAQQQYPQGTPEGASQEERIVVSPSLISAYLLNMGKAVFFIAALVGAFYLVQHLAGSNPFAEAFGFFGIPLLWGFRAFVVLSGLMLVLAFFSTLSLTSYELVFDGNNLAYSYGSFFKITRSTPVTNIIRVNFREYSPSSLGDITVELTGTEEKEIKVQFVSKAKEKCERINSLINQKKSAAVQQVDVEAGL